MAVTNGGMTLYTDNDTQQNWAGTDDVDIEIFIQGIASESWLIRQNTSETGELTLSAAMGTPKYVTMFMKSDISIHYVDIRCDLESTANNFEQFIISDQPTPIIKGEFHPAVMEIGQGVSTGTYVPNSHTVLRVIIDNTGSSHRAITNNWVDSIWYGSGRTIAGTTATDKVFTESDSLDKTSDSFDGCTESKAGAVIAQSDILINTTTGNSYGETLIFNAGKNTSNLYNLDVTGTAVFLNTNILGVSGLSTFAFDSIGATAFTMTGGAFTYASTSSFTSGQSISGTVFTSCGAIDSNGATLNNVTIGSTTATTATGSLIGNTPAEIALMDNITFNTYTGKYALYIPATNVGPIDLDGYSFDASGTDIYWAGTTGTLVVNLLNGSNATVTATAGGTISLVVAPVTTLITVKDIVTNTVIEGARVLLTAAAGGPLTLGTVIFNELTDVNGQVSDTRSLATAQPVTGRVRKASGAPFYKNVPISETINSTNGLSLNVAMIPDE